MATPELETILANWAIAWSSHDTGKVLARFTDDCIYEDVTFGVVTHGKDQLRAFAEACFVAVPDFRFELTTGFVAEARAAMEWLMSGTHRGDFPGMPATGKSFSEIRGATVIELAAAKIQRCSDYWDAATFMKQVGLLQSR